MPPGRGADTGGMQYALGPGGFPGPPASDWQLAEHPPGMPAPVDQINFTPATGEISPPGQQAPVDQLNLTAAQKLNADATPLLDGLRTVAPPQDPMAQTRRVLNMLGLMGADIGRMGLGTGQSVGRGQSSNPQPAPYRPPDPYDPKYAEAQAGMDPYRFGPNSRHATVNTQPPGGTQPSSEVADILKGMGLDAQAGDPSAPKVVNKAPTKGRPGYTTMYWDDGTESEIWDPPKTPDTKYEITKVGETPVLFDPATGKMQEIPLPEQPDQPQFVNVGGGSIAQINPDGSVQWHTAPDTSQAQEQPKAGFQLQTLPDGSMGVFDPNSGEIVNTIPANQKVSFLQGPSGGWIGVDEQGNVVTEIAGAEPEPPARERMVVGNDVYEFDPETGDPRLVLDQPDDQMVDGNIIRRTPTGYETVWTSPENTPKPISEFPLGVQQFLHDFWPDLYPTPNPLVGASSSPSMWRGRR